MLRLCFSCISRSCLSDADCIEMQGEERKREIIRIDTCQYGSVQIDREWFDRGIDVFFMHVSGPDPD